MLLSNPHITPATTPPLTPATTASLHVSNRTDNMPQSSYGPCDWERPWQGVE
jgi:hypothetical protein